MPDEAPHEAAGPTLPGDQKERPAIALTPASEVGRDAIDRRERQPRVVRARRPPAPAHGHRETSGAPEQQLPAATEQSPRRGRGANRSDRSWLRLGTLQGPWGIHGEIKVTLEAEPEQVARVRHIYVGAERLPFEVARLAQRGRTFSFALRGVSSIEEAQRLRGLEVGIPRTDAPPLPQGHFYHDEVLGLEAVTIDGRSLGRVTEILTTGANDVYVVHGPLGELLIPAIQSVVVALDPPTGLLRIAPLPGLLPDDPPARADETP